MTEANIYMMIVVNVSDVDKRPCSIDKSDVSTSLRRCGRYCTCMYYVCMRVYKKFLWRREKSLRSAFENTVGRVSRNRDFFQCGLIQIFCVYNSNDRLSGFFVIQNGIAIGVVCSDNRASTVLYLQHACISDLKFCTSYV